MINLLLFFIGTFIIYGTCVVEGKCENDTNQVIFVEVTAEAGLDFTHFDGRSGRRYFVETLGSSAAFFDYDNDGGVDIYLVNGADLPGIISKVPAACRLRAERQLRSTSPDIFVHFEPALSCP